MNFNTNMPIYIQVINQIKQDIVCGTLELGSKMPSARELAIKYKINPNTANRIYKEMETEEICYTRRGLGTFVTEDEKKIKSIRKEMAEELLQHFIGGMKDLGYEKEELLQLVETQYNKI